MLIIEGIDATGKSTLALRLSKALGCHIQESEGPAQSSDEIHHRISRYFEMIDTIFVRHPCVSQPIYSFTPFDIRPDVLADFYNQKHTFIYCHPIKPAQHVVKDHDTPELIKYLDEHYYDLLGRYECWALKHAHIIYRIGDDVGRILKMVKE